jgi:cytochrome c553
VSFDGQRVLFAYSRFVPGLAERENKFDKSGIPADAFYHVYEIKVDGTGLRQLTSGQYDDFDARYLPDGRIVFLSTRRGQCIQTTKETGAAARADSYMRCGGSLERPVPVYTLHVMEQDGSNIHAISPFESFEWHPSVAADGRILYSRWDYVDRDRLPYMSLWSTLPDGSAAQAVFGNYTSNPLAMFEPRAIPNSRKLVFTASAQHALTGGSLVVLELGIGADVPAAMKRLTPEVPFPESESWPRTYYANPYPLSEDYYLVAWSNQRLVAEDEQYEGHENPANALGLYLYDAFGNLDLIYRDPGISSMYPLPLRSRPHPAVVASPTGRVRRNEGRMLLLDVYQGLGAIPRGSIHRLRIVGLPPKTMPIMNLPQLGVTEDDPGKFVLGTVPVEEDGSAYFRVPSNMPLFLQALDADGMAVQTMRSAAYVPKGQTYACVGCHEPRNTAPANAPSLAALRSPSRITPGPEGSWPLDFDELVQPVMDRHCVSCHQAGGDGSRVNLTVGNAYSTLIAYGDHGTLQSHVLNRYEQGRSVAGACGARASALAQLLAEGHYQVQLNTDDWDRLITWMDTYAQQTGSFGRKQEQQLRDLRDELSPLLSRSR